MSLEKGTQQYLFGINTVKLDNPMLNCRIENNVDPIRIICDTNLDIALGSNIVKTANKIKTIIAYSNKCNKEKQEYLERQGITLLKIPYKNGIDLKALMIELGKMQIDSVLIEGGGRINASAIKSEIVNKVYTYIAPKIIGGETSLSPITGDGVELMKDAVILKNTSIEEIGNDYLITRICKIGKEF